MRRPGTVLAASRHCVPVAFDSRRREEYGEQAALLPELNPADSADILEKMGDQETAELVAALSSETVIRIVVLVLMVLGLYAWAFL